MLFRLSVASIALCTFMGCKTAGDTSTAKADFKDRRPETGESWTQARIVSFNEYANDLLNYSGDERSTYNEAALQLKTSLERAGVKHYDPLSSYTIMLGNFGECFGDSRSDYGIWWNSHRDAIKKQIEEVAFFVRDFHYIMLGKAQGAFSFREVIICPEEKVGTKMLLAGYKLYIGVPYSYGYYRPIPNTGSGGETLRGLWDAGYPIGVGDAGTGLFGSLRALFDSERKAQIAAKNLWSLFNPLAATRQGLRRLLHEQRGTILGALARLLPTLASATPAAREGLIDLAYPDRTTSAGAPPAETLPDLATEDGKTLATFADNWKCLLENAATVAGVENDAMAMVQDNIKKTDVQHIVEAGLVAVANHHDVGVLVAVGSGDFSRYLDASVMQEFKVQNRATAGLVAVSTSDNIMIDVRFLRSSGSAMRRGTFDKAFAATKRGEDLCAAK